MKRIHISSGLAAFILVLLIVLISEITLRFFENALSGDISHINSIDTILDEMGKSESVNILFIGNSLIGDGIDPEYFTSQLADKGVRDVRVFKVVPDGTNLLDWYYILKNKLRPVQHRPDLIVLGYAWNQLADDHAIDHIRLGAHFCKFSDFPELTGLGLTQFGAQSEFFISGLSTIFANRSTIRNRILDIIIPFYRSETRNINNFENVNVNPVPLNSSKPQYARLQHTLELLHEINTNVMIIAMPILEKYDVDPDLHDLLKRENVTFLDCRFIPRLEKDHFVDHMHLGSAGQKVLCSFLVNNIYSEHRDYVRHLSLSDVKR